MTKSLLISIIKNKNFFLPFLFILIFFTIVILTTPIKQTFEYNPDEGINLIKTSLFQNGFSLYKEIWNDQPPLFTLILSFWLKMFGQSVYSARILILIFSSILLWALYQIIRIRQGHLCAFIALIFLISSRDYILLSTSIMIGIPALCLALLSILFVVSYAKDQSNYLIILSGAFMGLSLQTKFFTAFLIPIILLEIIQNSQLYLKKKKYISSIGLWLISFSLVYLFITLIFFRLDPQLFIKNLFQPHFLKSAFAEFRYSFLSTLILLFKDSEIVIFALTSTFLIKKQKKRQLLFPLLWLASACIILFNHRPVWKHHYLLISIPLCWLAAEGLNKIIILTKINKKKFLKMKVLDKLNYLLHLLIVIVLIVLVVINLSAKYRTLHENLAQKISSGEEEVIRMILKHKNSTRWMFTDRPIFAFSTNILVPPELAVFSSKRRITKNLTPDDLISVLNKYKPEQIVLGRFQNYHPNLLSYIKKYYIEVHDFEIRKPLIISEYILWRPKRIWFGKYMLKYKTPFIEQESYPSPIKKIKILLRKDIAKLIN